MKSGIPGVEKLFSGPGAAAGPGGKKQSKGFHKMNDSSKQKFMTAVFGEDGTTIDSGTAAALLAATCSGGDPTIANNIAELLLPEIGDEIDQAMMGALMAACSLINAGASTEEVSLQDLIFNVASFNMPTRMNSRYECQIDFFRSVK